VGLKRGYHTVFLHGSVSPWAGMGVSVTKCPFYLCQPVEAWYIHAIMDRFSKEVVKVEHCEPCRQIKTGNHIMITLAARKHTVINIIVHDELVVDEQRIED
jgi:recombinational DNA repair protein RecR